MYQQLLKGKSEQEVILLTEMLEKIKPKALNAFTAVNSDGTRSNKDELLSILLQIVRLCWEKSGIQDSEWIASDFEKWIDEEKETIEHKFKNAFMRIDAVIDVQIWYTDIHGNRYLKEHGNKLWNESK